MVGIEKACLKRLRESGLKSETRSTLIHILSSCYEDPKTVRILSREPPLVAEIGELVREGVSDGVGVDIDVLKVVSSNEENSLKESEQVVRVVGANEVRKEYDKPVDVSVDGMEYISAHEVKDSQKRDDQVMEHAVDVVKDVSSIEMKDLQVMKEASTNEVNLQKEGYQSMDFFDDVVKHVSTKEVKSSQHGECQSMEFSIDTIENMTMDVDIDAMEGLVEGSIIDEEVVDWVQNSLLETAGLGDQPDASFSDVNDFFNAVELGFTVGEAKQCGSRDDKCFPSQKLQLERQDNVLEYANVVRMNESDDIEEGEIDNVDVNYLHVSIENNSDIEQHNETAADQPNDIKQRKLLEEASCSDFSCSGIVGSVEKENIKYHPACSNDGAENMIDTSISTSEAKAKIKESVAAVAKHGHRCPDDSRRPVFYGDISEETCPNSQGTLKAGADDIKKNKRGGNKEKKKIKKRKKRAEMDKKLGVKRMKLPPILKPKVVKVCEHYLKGRCLKGEECTFSHDATPLTKSKACVHFARNNCMKGDACPYDHQPWKYPCDNYVSKGFCNRGNSCLFSHEIPAKEESQCASLAAKISLQALPTSGISPDGSMSSAAKSSIKPPMRIPKGLSFLSLGKSGSDHLTMPDPNMSLLNASNYSTDTVSGIVKTLGVTPIPIAKPLSSHFNNNKNLFLKATPFKKVGNLTSPLDQALLGLDSMISSKVPLNPPLPPSHSGLSVKEHNPPLPRSNRLNMHQLFKSSVENEKLGCQVGDHKGLVSKSKSHEISNMCEEATQEKVPDIQCFLTESSKIEQSQKLNATIPKDDQVISTKVQGRQTIKGKPHAISEELKSPTPVALSSVLSSCEGITASQSLLTAFQNALLSTSTPASKLEFKTNEFSLGSEGTSQLPMKPGDSIPSSSKSAINCEPVKASTILDFIFGSGSKTK